MSPTLLEGFLFFLLATLLVAYVWALYRTWRAQRSPSAKDRPAIPFIPGVNGSAENPGNQAAAQGEQNRGNGV